jgi:hypothetical protein
MAKKQAEEEIINRMSTKVQDGKKGLTGLLRFKAAVG